MAVATEKEILEARKNQKYRNREVVAYISGTWDLFHVGHLNAIKKARELGDKLIVGISTDELVRKYKKREPIFPYEQRLKIIESLKFVDEIVTQHELSTIEQFQELDFDILVVGEDWKDKFLDGIEWIKQHPEKKVVFLPRTSGISSSILRERLDKISGDL